MNITVKTGAFTQEQSDVIAIGILENPDFYSAPLQNIEQVLGGRIREVMNLGDFKGKHKTTCWLYTNGAIAAPRVLLVGLGEYHDLTVEKVREAAGNAARTIRDMGLSTAAIPIPIEATPEMIQAAAEATLLALYQFNEHKTDSDDDDEKKKLESITFLAESEQSKAMIENAAQRGETIATGTLLARDLSNQPANYLTPTQLAEKAQTVAETSGLGCEIFDKATLEEKGFRTLLAVAQGSAEEPRFIILEYTPDGEGKPDTVVLVGKGITFDTGGISLKSGSGMHEMKHDMSGAAAVIGAMQVIGQLKPNVRVIGVVAATENMPSGTAVKPGDVITSYGGKTIEILNTDAEGRLVLADALGWTAQYNPKGVIDLATLTGAVITCLGHIAAGAMGTDAELMAKVKSAAVKTHERVWELPLWDDYDEGVKSKVADVQNIGDGGAGTIAGGAFLKKFAEGYPWVHLDIAGTAWGMKGAGYIPEGASGYGVRLLVQLVEDW